ncbi:proton-conducting transporter transmembrane domain-containing protein [Halomonas sp. BC04]|uniref:proton-conducting transporter transmembrane domain-containing protein n=1 Tax=Halomonas sp. BC04 TaxID=1403540 RepID=UPI001E620C18|nr:proton-conducting transporter membrane subunit [Halomonas sp. BC04]
MSPFPFMEATVAIPLTLLIPALGAVLIALSGRHPNLRDGLMVAIAALLFATVLQILPAVLAGERPAITLIELLPGLSMAFEVEPLGMIFALVASSLWIITSLYAIGYMRGAKESKQTRFHACFAVALFSVMGIAFAENMFTLFIFYEVLTLSTYPLVAHKGNREAQQGARTYLVLLLGTSIGFQLVAIVATWWLAGSLSFTEGGIMEGHVSHALGGLLLLLYIYGIGKAALMPFHRWLPAAMVAPTPVSALLHAVAVVKAGVFTVLKVSTYIFGQDYLRELWSADLLMTIAAFSLLSASLVALQKDNLKARLAYSTVSQLSYITLGAMLAHELAAIGGGMHIVMHAFGKITLFFCAGAIYVASKKTNVSEMDGLGRRMPFTMGAYLLGALAVIGVPPMGGLWSKWHLVLGAADSGQLLMVLVIMLSTLLNIAYLLRPAVRAFLMPPKEDGGRGIREAPLLCVVPLCITALGCMALFLAADPLRAMLGGIFGS